MTIREFFKYGTIALASLVALTNCTAPLPVAGQERGPVATPSPIATKSTTENPVVLSEIGSSSQVKEVMAGLQQILGSDYEIKLGRYLLTPDFKAFTPRTVWDISDEFYKDFGAGADTNLAAVDKDKYYVRRSLSSMLMNPEEQIWV